MRTHAKIYRKTGAKADYAQAVTEYNNAIKQPIFENPQLSKQLILDRQSPLLGAARRYSTDHPSQNRRRVHPTICNLTTCALDMQYCHDYASRVVQPGTVMTTRRTWLALLVAAGLAWTGGVQPVSAQGKAVVVFAAASLKNGLDEIAGHWRRETGKKAIISYGGSNTLIKQIEKGAPADIFLSADLEWMDYGQQKDLIKPESRFNLLGNRLVLIARREDSRDVNIQQGFDLVALLKGGRLAMGNVEAVPAGIYGKAALEKLGVWDNVKDEVTQAENVRAALVLVSKGKASLGIVYQTDAAADLGVKIVGLFPENTHPRIIYPVALTKASTNADAQTFLNYMRLQTRSFEIQGFTVLLPGERS